MVVHQFEGQDTYFPVCFGNNPHNAHVKNSYCILRNADISSPLYVKWVAAFEETNSLCAVTVSKDDEIMNKLGIYHRSMNQARAYLDAEYELTDINELL